MRPVPRLKKNAAAKLINTRVMKGVASPNRNQAIIHGGKEIEMSLIAAAGYAQEPGASFPIGRPTAGNFEDDDKLTGPLTSIPAHRNGDGNRHQAAGANP